jgi:GNAT superfamily N-acetyltransferase
VSQAAPLPAPPAVTFRPASAQEAHEWIVPSWIASYSHRLPAKMLRADTPRGFGRQIYWNAMEGRIRRLLSVPDVAVKVADVDGVSAGWACEDRKARVLHYVYVKDTFRRQGVGKALVGWIDDTSAGLVRIAAMPPVWFTARGDDPTQDPWKQHQVIDILTSY